MTIENFLEIASFGMQTSVIVSAPILLAGLIAGLMVSIFQAATQVNDAALAFIPKILATVAALMFFGPWMISQMAAFTTYAFNLIPNITL